jgi:hypothetical protein
MANREAPLNEGSVFPKHLHVRITGNSSTAVTYLQNHVLPNTGSAAVDPVVAVTTANVTRSGSLASGNADGVTVPDGKRLLVGNQTDSTENGFYIYRSGADWIRTTDEITAGMMVVVLQGATYAESVWTCTNDTDPVVGTDAITFRPASAVALVDGSTIEVSAHKASVKDNGITTAKLADDAVTGPKIDEDAVDEFHINSGTLGSGLIGGSGTLIQVNPDNVTIEVDGSNKVSVKDGGITPAKIDPTGASSGDVLTYTGSAVAWEAPAGGDGDVKVRCVIAKNFSGSSEVPNGIPSSGDADGVTLTGGEDVLVIQEDDQTLIGLYIVSAGTWARSSDTITAGMQVQVMFGGTTYGGAVFHCRNTTDPVVGTDNITFGVSKALPLADSVSTTAIVDNAVTNAKLRDSAALSVIGRSVNTTGDPADIAASTDGHVLRRSGTTLGFGQIATGGIADGAVTNDKLRDSVGLSVMGRTSNSTGSPADINAVNDAEVLRRSGTTLGFGQIATGGIADGAVTGLKLEDDIELDGVEIVGWFVRAHNLAPLGPAGLQSMDEDHPICFVDTTATLGLGVTSYGVVLPVYTGVGSIPIGVTLEVWDAGNNAATVGRNIIVSAAGNTFADGTATQTINTNGRGLRVVLNPSGLWQYETI